MADLRLCCVGWVGPSMDEHWSGVLPHDPDALFMETGAGTDLSEARYYGTNYHRRKISDPAQVVELANRHDAMLIDTYYFSNGHRGCIHSYFPDDSDMLVRPELDDIKCLKILNESEATAGESNFQFYKNAARRCDAVITLSPAMKKWCDEERIPCHLDVIGVSPIFTPGNRYRDIDVLYTGSCLTKGYRAEIKDVLEKYGQRRNVVIFGSVPLMRYIEFLQRSKVVMCSQSCASGEKMPFGPKHKSFKALLSGAVPIEERWEGGPEYLQTWTEKLVFDNVRDIPDVIEMTISDKDKMKSIVTAGRDKVLSNYLYQHVYERAFRKFGLIK